MDSRMTRKTRQLYLLFVLIISFITLPSILLYSSGYRIDFNNFSIEPTGALVIVSIPKDAVLTIAEKNIVDATPSIVSRLQPGEYTVSITKDGYSTWQDTIHIQGRRSTIVGTVMIFKTNPQTKTLSEYPSQTFPDTRFEDIQDFSPDVQFALSRIKLSDDYKITSKDVPIFTILDKTHTTLYLLDTRSAEIEVQKISDSAIDFEWNTETNELLFYSEHEISLYNFDSQETRSIIRQSDEITEAFWHPRSNYVVFTTGRQIQAIETRLTDSPNITTIYYGDLPHSVRTNKKGTALYLTESDNTTLEVLIQ